MCLIIKNNKKKKTPIKARKDIVCYKRLTRKSWGEKGYETPFRSMKVNIGSRGSRLKATLGIYHNRVEQGIHAYTTKEKAIRSCYYGGIVVIATIPKGAEYLLGKYNDIVATEMKLGKIIHKSE